MLITVTEPDPIQGLEGWQNRSNYDNSELVKKKKDNYSTLHIALVFAYRRFARHKTPSYVRV